jgi:hypothetical protein
MYHSLVSYLIGPDHLSLANLLFEVHPPQLLRFLRLIFQTTSETLLVIVEVLILLLNMTMSPRGDLVLHLSHVFIKQFFGVYPYYLFIARQLHLNFEAHHT